MRVDHPLRYDNVVVGAVEKGALMVCSVVHQDVPNVCSCVDVAMQKCRHWRKSLCIGDTLDPHTCLPQCRHHLRVGNVVLVTVVMHDMRIAYAGLN